MKNIFIMILCFCYSYNYAQIETASEVVVKAYELLNDDDYNGAMGLLNKYVREMPDSSQLYFTKGVILNAYKRFPESVEEYTKALELTDDPEERAILYMNRSSSRTTDRDGAYKDLILALEADSTNINILNNLSIVCGYMDKKAEALEYLKKIVVIDDQYLPGYINLGFTYQKLDEHEAAITYFDKALTIKPDAPRAYSNRSFSKLKLNDLKGAHKDINKSIKLLPSNSYAYKIRALIYIEENKMEEACKDLTLAERMYYTEEYGDEVKELLTKHCK